MVSPPSSLAQTATSITVGIVGATGAVGMEMVKLFDKKNLSNLTVKLYASGRSAGKKVKTENLKADDNTPFLTIIEYETEEVANTCNVVLLATSGDWAKEYVPQLHKLNPDLIVIDNSSAFRYDNHIPLIVPEINGERDLILNKEKKYDILSKNIPTP